MTREDAVKALEVRLMSDDVIYVGDTSYPEALSMAIEALKAQEPRLLTYEDFNNNPAVDSKGRLPAWVEHNWKLGPSLVDDGYSAITKKEMENWDKSFVRWWTSRPTDEQRRVTPWQG